MSSTNPRRVTVFGENHHDVHDESVRAIYPDGMHTTIARAIERLLPGAVTTRTVTQDQPEHGLTAEVLADTDVLVWWGHWIHQNVEDAVVDRVHQAVLDGMGLIVLHSGHHSKIFKKLMGTTCNLRWRGGENRETIWTVNPTHPIAKGIPSPFILDSHEMYGEFFDVPVPEDLIFISAYDGGEAFRGGLTYRRGHGKIFYFSPGDQEYPIYHHEVVQQVIANAVEWTAPAREVRGAPPVVWKRGKGYGDQRPEADFQDLFDHGMEVISTHGDQVTMRNHNGWETVVEA